MARIRSIKPDFWSSEQVMNLSRDARLLFIGMWNFQDDAGRGKFNARTLKAQVLPGDDDVSAADVERWVGEILAQRLAVRYEAGGQVYIAVTGWQHQKIDRPRESTYPAPPVIAEHSANPRRAIAEPSPTDIGEASLQSVDDPSPLDRKGSEGIGRDRNPPTPHGGEVADGVRPWTAERASVVFRKLFEDRWGTPPSMGGKNVTGFHETVASTAANRKADPEALFREMLTTWFRDPKWAVQADKDAAVWRRSPYACFVQQWGPLTMVLGPNGARKSAGPSIAEQFAAKGWVMP